MSEKPLVLIEVLGGVADYSATSGVSVLLVDWDNIEAGDSCEIPEEFHKVFPRLRLSIENIKRKRGRK